MSSTMIRSVRMMRSIALAIESFGRCLRTSAPRSSMVIQAKVSAALRMWRNFVRNPYRRVWVDYRDGGCGIFECCGSPWEARDLLEFVMTAMSERSSRELRRVVDRLDRLY